MILDAGVFILAERNPSRLAALLEEFLDEPLLTNEAVMAQVWRQPATQVLVTRFLDEHQVDVEPLANGRAIGRLLGHCGASDVVDGSVALMGLAYNDVVLTSDPGDLTSMGATVVNLGS